VDPFHAFNIPSGQISALQYLVIFVSHADPFQYFNRPVGTLEGDGLLLGEADGLVDADAEDEDEALSD
jgi:hypothetical protein